MIGVYVNIISQPVKNFIYELKVIQLTNNL